MSPELAAALRRLDAALGALEGAVARHLDVEGRKSEIETELQIMQDDRARLALDLEGTTAELARVRGAAEHVGRRVGDAVAAVESVLARAGPEPEAQAAREG